MDEIRGRLRLEWDTGLVYLRARRTQGCDDEADEFLGFIGDPDNCPAGLASDWAWLADLWEDARRAGAAYAATVDGAYFGRLSPERWR